MDKQKITEAVNYLIQADNYAKLIKEITNIVERWDTHPMAYAGKLSVLNALIDVGVTSREAFERLVTLIETKRKLLPDTKRLDYQRELMAKRRARINKAVELQELVTGKAFSATRRKDYIAELTERWHKARAEFIESRGELSWKDRNDAAGEFWEMIDRQLDDAIKKSRKRG